MDLSAVDILVLDEADKMLNLGFQEDMNQIFKLYQANVRICCSQQP
jgi:ATP-dependent RNA helicase RhlE